MTRRVGLSLPPDLYNLLGRIAKKNNKSRPALIL